MQLPVSEIFYSLQGEGALAGTPAVFVRLQGCPIRCPWCDTKHTWVEDPNQIVSSEAMLSKGGNNPRREYALMGFDEILAMVKGSAHPNGTPLIVITGGEPLIHIELPAFINFLTDQGFEVQIETSGTFPIRDLLDLCEVRPYITVSPKYNINPNYPVHTADFLYADEVKVVVARQEDVDFLMEELKRWEHIYAPTNLYLQPNALGGSDAIRFTIEQCKKLGFKLSLQTHKLVGIE